MRCVCGQGEPRHRPSHGWRHAAAVPVEGATSDDGGGGNAPDGGGGGGGDSDDGGMRQKYSASTEYLRSSVPVSTSASASRAASQATKMDGVMTMGSSSAFNPDYQLNARCVFS